MDLIRYRRLLALALFSSGAATADPLIFVTADQLSLRESTNLGVVIDSAPYSLPAGYSVVGGDVDPDNGDLGLIARNSGSGQCQVFFEGGDVGDTVVFNAIGPALACDAQAGDLEFINSGGGTDLGWAIAMGGSSISAITPADAQYESLTVTAPAGASVDLAGVALTGPFGVIGRLLNRAGGGSVGSPDFSGDGTSIGIANPAAISGAVINGPTSLDVSETSGVVYLLTDGKVYGLTETGVAVLIGDAPAGTLAMFVDQVGSDPDDDDDGSDGDGSDDDADEDGGNLKVGSMSGSGLLVLLLALGLRYGLRARRAAR